MYTRKVRDDPKEYKIYTKEEAKEEGIDWVYWKDAEPGDWAITDDEYVMECRRRHYAKTGSDDVVLSGCRAFDNPRSTLEFEPHLEHGSFNYVRPQPAMEAEARMTRTQVAAMRVAAELVNGTPWKDMPWYEIGAQMRPDRAAKSRELTVNLVKKIFRSDEVMNEVQKKVVEILDDQGFSNDDIVGYYKRLMEHVLPEDDEEGEVDVTNARHILKAISEMKGIDKPQHRTSIEEVGMDFSRQIMGDVEKQEGKLNAKRTRMITDGDDEDE